MHELIQNNLITNGRESCIYSLIQNHLIAYGRESCIQSLIQNHLIAYCRESSTHTPKYGIIVYTLAPWLSLGCQYQEYLSLFVTMDYLYVHMWNMWARTTGTSLAHIHQIGEGAAGYSKRNGSNFLPVNGTHFSNSHPPWVFHSLALTAGLNRSPSPTCPRA